MWLQRGGNVLDRLEEEEVDPLDEDATKPEWCDPLDWQCAKLRKRSEVASARAEAYAVTIIRKHMPDQWTAAMTYLERRFPDRWKRRDSREITQVGERLPTIDEDALLQDPDAVGLIHDALEKASRGELPETTG